MKLLLDVFENYAASREQRVAKHTASADQVALLQSIPTFFEAALEVQGRASDFLVEGSIGRGNVARVPWVATFRRDITSSAQTGFYIVLLFAEDLSRCYLSLNQGFTKFSQQYSEKLALKKIREAAVCAEGLVSQHSDVVIGAINLAATGKLGKGYEAGAIKSYEYLADRLPTRERLEQHFNALLADYDALYHSVGASLQSLILPTEAEFQDAALEKAVQVKKDFFAEPGGGVPKPEHMLKSSSGYSRSADVAAAALKMAKFECQVDPSHSTFLTRVKNTPYVEAHHLIPFSRQVEFEFSLDVTANIVSLCPTCHRKLHSGRAEDNAPILKKLLKERSAALAEKKISVQWKTLSSYYKSSLLNDDD